MFLHTIRSGGLAHLSYLVGAGGQAAVIDPRRDVGVYLDRARHEGARITHIFETHRNEDHVVGSQELARCTGATILHGRARAFAYGEPADDGDRFEFGDARLTVLETPGHTAESISLALADTAVAADDPVAVFTGDALFVGSVGRTDLDLGGGADAAAHLYDSIHRKLLPLGDHVILHPAHGAGSICGSGMARREFSTLGHERRHSSLLQVDRDEFVRRQTGARHQQPPYFRRMEELNQQGNPRPLAELPVPWPLQPPELAEAVDQGALVVDTRSAEAFAGAFIPGSLALPLTVLSDYAGWLLPYDRPLVLVADGPRQLDTSVRRLRRLGFDAVTGYLEEGLFAWETSGRAYDRIAAVHVQELAHRFGEGDEFTLLDVRKPEEFAAGHFPGARHIFLGELPHRVDEVPRGRPVTTFCGSGQRAIVAAAILKQHGFDRVEDALGSMAACRAAGCTILDGDDEQAAGA
ncbi:MAG: MBL fold metallo-hydrolase [Candidatus Krumholzibacteriia bacterium]